MADFYERNRITRPIPNAASSSQLLDMRSRDRMLRYAYIAFVQNSRKWRRTPLWSFVGTVTGHGSGYSAQICVELGWDPDMPCGQVLPERETKVQAA